VVDLVEAMARAIHAELAKHPGNTVVTGEPCCAVINGVFDLEDVARAAWNLALDHLVSDESQMGSVAIIQLKRERRAILPG
jgi:hypothetical protein